MLAIFVASSGIVMANENDFSCEKDLSGSLDLGEPQALPTLPVRKMSYSKISLQLPIFSNVEPTSIQLYRDGEYLGILGKTPFGKYLLLEPEGEKISSHQLNRFSTFGVAVPVLGLTRIQK